MKPLRSFFYPRKYEIYDSSTEKLKFTGSVEGYSRFSYSIFDINGVELIHAQKRKAIRYNFEHDILKSGNAIASFGRYRFKRLKSGYEIRTNTHTYKTIDNLNFKDESGKDVFTIYAQSRKEIFIDVDQNFDVEIALICTLILVFWMILTYRERLIPQC